MDANNEERTPIARLSSENNIQDDSIEQVIDISRASNEDNDQNATNNANGNPVESENHPEQRRIREVINRLFPELNNRDSSERNHSRGAFYMGVGVLLVILKFFYINIIPMLIFVSGAKLVEETEHARNELRSGLTLKKYLRAFATAISTISFLFICMYFVSNTSLWRRLLFLEPTTKAIDNNSSITNTIWLVVMTDMTAFELSQFCKICAHCIIYKIHRRYGNRISKRPVTRDIEAGHVETARLSPNSRQERSTPRQASPMDIFPSYVSEVSGLMYAILRRRDTGTSQTQSANVDSDEAVPMLADSNSSDNSRDGDTEPSMQIVLIRTNLVIDAIFLSYRWILPLKQWLIYFGHGLGEDIFTASYTVMKLYVLSQYLVDAFVIIHMYYSGSVEYGVYVKDNELPSSCECPICFDVPQNAVRLSCHHTFCEVCIMEWLGKEKTCPVCRANIASNFPSIAAVKAGSSSKFLHIM